MFHSLHIDPQVIEQVFGMGPEYDKLIKKYLEDGLVEAIPEDPANFASIPRCNQESPVHNLSFYATQPGYYRLILH